MCLQFLMLLLSLVPASVFSAPCCFVVCFILSQLIQAHSTLGKFLLYLSFFLRRWEGHIFFLFWVHLKYLRNIKSYNKDHMLQIYTTNTFDYLIYPIIYLIYPMIPLIHFIINLFWNYFYSYSNYPPFCLRKYNIWRNDDISVLSVILCHHLPVTPWSKNKIKCLVGVGPFNNYFIPPKESWVGQNIPPWNPFFVWDPYNPWKMPLYRKKQMLTFVL